MGAGELPVAVPHLWPFRGRKPQVGRVHLPHLRGEPAQLVRRPVHPVRPDLFPRERDRVSGGPGCGGNRSRDRCVGLPLVRSAVAGSLEKMSAPKSIDC
jgi:hypothetical protein